METVKEAADSLFKKGKISQEEYDALEKSGSLELTKEALRKVPKSMKFARKLNLFFDTI